jgi:hypothetical protein
VDVQNTHLITGTGEIVSGPVTVKARISESERRVGFVAFVDVLGFRAIAADGNRLVEYGAKVETSLDDSRIQSVVFSDSMIITKEGTDAESLRVLCEVCSRLMFNLIRACIPVRGAIAAGPFFRQILETGSGKLGRSVFLAGSPIIEAYDYEPPLTGHWAVPLPSGSLRAKTGG